MHRIIIRQHQAAAILFTLIGAALLLFLIFSAAMSSSAAAGTIIHVDKDAALGGDGTTWGTAYKYLQDGLAAATSGDEIWVAEGIYYPDEDEGGNVTDNDRNASFNFKDSVEIFGGFAGSETSRDERDWETNLTVLSGDIDKNDSGKVSGVLQSHSGITGDNSYHVVLASNIDLALLDGFAITGGDADYGTGSTGGGIYLNQSNDIILANLNIRGNRAIVGFGGGISIEKGNGLIISRSTIRNNFAEIFGGGIKLGSASVLIEASHILENEARDPALSCLVDVSGGGGLQIGGGSTTLNDVVFEKNLSDCVGGGIAMNRGALYMHGGAFLNNKVRPSLNSAGGGLFTINSGTVAIENALFTGNIAKARGGAVNLAYAGNQSSKNLRFTNTTIVANEADSYGAIILNANTNTELTLANMIVADNINSNAFVNDGNIFVANSLVQDSGGSGVSWNTAFGTDQGGNIDTVPGFIQPPIGAAPNVSGDFRLSLGSPAIDAGLNSAVTLPTDNVGNPRIFNGTVDMGAYETQVLCPAGGTTRLYVDATASGTGTGTSWTDALPRLQDALALAKRCPSNSIDEVWVAQGTYYPDEGAYQNDDDRSAAFQLQNGLAIYGGFLGNETNLNERDPWHYITVLSGDIGQDDNTDAHDLVETPADIVGDNSFHVVIGSATDSSARLDGFAITGGQANGSAAVKEHEGGGLFAQTGGPTLNQLTFVGNIAEEGGAMTLVAGSAPQITNTWFGGNVAGDYGGALHNESSDPTLTNVLMSGNLAVAGGGAIYNLNSSPELNNVTIAGNTAGGSVVLSGFTPQAVQVAPRGGGIFNLTSSKPLIRNSIIWNNEDDSGVGTASASIHNQDTGSTPTADYSDIQGRDGIIGLIFDPLDTIDDDPLFVAPVTPSSAPSFNGDYRLKGLSPVIDEGDNSFNSLPTDLAGNPRKQGASIDMGAYEAAPTPDFSVHKTSDTPTAVVGDTINYTYEVINTGGVAITGLTAVDDLLGPITLSTDNLAVGASATGNLSYTVLAGDLPGPIVNTAIVTGTVGASTTVVMTDTVDVSLSYRPQIAVSISADKGSALPGETVTYDYLVTNTGDVELSSVAVNDSRLGAITLDATTLAPGASASGTAAYLVQGSDLPGPLANTATASGDSPAGTTVQDQDTAVVSVISPAQPSDQYLPVVLKFYPPATPTPTPTNTPTITPTPSPTPTNTPSPITCQNVVGNSGFEDLSAWRLETTAYTAAYSTVQQNTGARSVRTGITNQLDNIFSYSSAMQTITIPPDATKADLRYYIYPQTTETMAFVAPENALEIEEHQAGTASDIQLVLILDLNNNELARLYGDRRNDRTWLLGTRDLLNFKGQTIKLYFGTFNNGRWNQGVTAMYVDDVTLEVCAPN